MEPPKTRGLVDAEKPSAYVIVTDDARAKIEWPRCLDKPRVRLDPGASPPLTDGWIEREHAHTIPTTIFQ